MTPLFIEDHRKYVVVEDFNIPVTEGRRLGDLLALSKDKIIETTTAFNDEFGDAMIDCYIFTSASASEYERMVRIRKDHLERMIDSGKLKKYITSVVKDINVDVDQEFVVQRDIENTRFKRGDDIIVRALNSEYIYVESKDACEKLDIVFFKSLIPSKTIINKGKFDVVIKLPATDRTIKQTFCVVREPKVGQVYMILKSRPVDTDKVLMRGDLATIRKVLGDTVDIETSTCCSRFTIDDFKSMIVDGILTLKVPVEKAVLKNLGAQQGVKVSSRVAETKILPSQVYVFTKDCVFFDDISGSNKAYTIKEGTTLTVSDALCSCEQFNISSDHPVHLSLGFIVNAIAKGELKLADIPNNPDESSDETPCSDSRIKEGQVYRVTQQVPHNMDAEEILFKKGCTVKILKVRNNYINILIDDEKGHRQFFVDSITYWIDKGIFVLEDSTNESPLKTGQIYEVVHDTTVDGPNGSKTHLKAGETLTINKWLATSELFNWDSDSGKRIHAGLSDKWLESAVKAGTIKLVEDAPSAVDQFKFNRPFKMKEGQTYRVESKNIEGFDPAIVKGDLLYVESVEDPYVTVKKDCGKHGIDSIKLVCDIFEEWINEKWLILEDEEIVVKSGHKYRVKRDIKSNFTDELRHKEGEILEVTQVDEAYVSYRTGETNMRESADKFRHLIALETLVLVGSEFNGEMPCELKDGMKFKFAKKFERFGDGCDFNPGDVIILDRVTDVKCTVLNESGCPCGTFSIEWLQNAIKNGMLVPYVEPTDDDILSKITVGSMWKFLNPCISRPKTGTQIWMIKVTEVTDKVAKCNLYRLHDGLLDGEAEYTLDWIVEAVKSGRAEQYTGDGPQDQNGTEQDRLVGRKYKVRKDCTAHFADGDRIILNKGDTITVVGVDQKLSDYYNIKSVASGDQVITKSYIQECILEKKIVEIKK